MATFSDSMVERIQELLSENEDISRKEFVAAVGKIFSELKGKPERKKKVSKKTDEADDKVVKPKRAPSKYNIYMKEQMPILAAREKDKGEDKKTTRELMQEIGEMWKLEKERVKSESENASSEDDKAKTADKKPKNAAKSSKKEKVVPLAKADSDEDEEAEAAKSDADEEAEAAKSDAEEEVEAAKSDSDEEAKPKKKGETARKSDGKKAPRKAIGSTKK
jgi:hypothetical protein